MCPTSTFLSRPVPGLPNSPCAVFGNRQVAVKDNLNDLQGTSLRSPGPLGNLLYFLNFERLAEFVRKQLFD
jgi:hypothetical protein